MKKLALLLVLLFAALASATTISNISVSQTTGSSATVTWTTSTPSTSQVIFGLNGGTGSATPTNQTPTTSHTVTISPLVAEQVYTYKTVSVDIDGSTTSSSNTFQLCSGSGPTAGFTNVTGTIGVAYAQGQVSAVWVNDSGTSTSTPTVCGQAFPTTISSVLTTTGNLSLQLPDNNIIVPSPGRWTLNVSNATGNVGQFSITTPIVGTAIGLTSQLQAASAGQLQLIYYDPATGLFDPPIVPSVPAGAPGIGAAPSPIDFGQVQTGTTSPVVNLSISSTGDLPVTVKSVSIDNPKFGSTNIAICNQMIGGGGQDCNVPITYHPTSAVTDTANVTIVSNSPLGNLTVSLTGQGNAGPTFPFTVDGGTSTGSGTLTTDDGFILCTIAPPAAPAGLCGHNYASGTAISLRAVANQTSLFSTFSGAGCTTSPCTPTITSATNVSANFTIIPPTFKLSIASAGQGTVTITSDVATNGGLGILNCLVTAGVLTSAGNAGCNGVFNVGTTVTLTATLGGSSTFTGWVGNNACTTVVLTCPVVVSGDSSIAANVAPPAATTALGRVQTMNKAQVASSTTIAQVFSQAQGAGNTNLIGISWPNNTATISSIADSKLNTYTQFAVISPATQAGESQAVYCATGIAAAAAGTNTVTVTMSTGTSSVDIRGVEYAGVASCTPDDKNVGKATTGTAMDSGVVTTTHANDLLVAFNAVASSVNLSTPSNGQTWTYAISPTSFGNDVEDILGGVPTATAVHNLAHQNSTGDWISQIVALQAQTTTQNNFSLTIQCAGPGSATSITSSFGTPPINATCTAGQPGGSFSTSVPSGQSGSLNVTPAANSTLALMFGGGCSTNPQCLTNAITQNTTIVITLQTATSACTGPYSITNQPPAGCPFYGQGTNNVTNKKLPADVLSHLAINSDVMAVAAFNAGGTANGFTYPTNWASVGTDDNGNPLYYSVGTDPWYKFGAGCSQTTGIQNAPAFHARNNASFNDTHRSDGSTNFFSDANIRFFDTSTNALAGNYRANNSVTPTTIGSCGATSSANACTLVGGGACGEAINAFTDADWGSPNGWVQRAGNEGSSGLAPMAGIIRGTELINGQINHALILGLSCTDAYQGSFHVFPSPIDTAHCPVVSPGQTNAPANGALFFLDYTDAQITGMGLPAWQKTIITALSHYGGYIDVTTGGAAVGMIVFHESPLPYQVQTGGTITQRTTSGGISGMYVTGGTPDPIVAFLTSAVGCGGTSGTSDCKFGLQIWNNIPNVGGTDVTHHMHIADPCIAEGYANQPGGCF